MSSTFVGGWVSVGSACLRAPSAGFEPATSEVSWFQALRDWPRAAAHRAGSKCSGSRPMQLVGLQGTEECQAPPPSCCPSGLSTISCESSEEERAGRTVCGCRKAFLSGCPIGPIRTSSLCNQHPLQAGGGGVTLLACELRANRTKSA